MSDEGEQHPSAVKRQGKSRSIPAGLRGSPSFHPALQPRPSWPWLRNLASRSPATSLSNPVQAALLRPVCSNAPLPKLATPLASHASKHRRLTPQRWACAQRPAQIVTVVSGILSIKMLDVCVHCLSPSPTFARYIATKPVIAESIR